MAIPFFEENMDIIGALSDFPGSEDGLTPHEFKNRFDVGGNRIKSFLNSTVVPKINELIESVGAFVAATVDKTLSKNGFAADAKATGDKLNEKFDKTGGNISGYVNMTGNRVMNISAPLEDTDAANRDYVHRFVEQKVTETHFVRYATIPASWSGNAPYTATVPVADVVADDVPNIFPVYSDNLTTAIAQKEAWMMVNRGKPANGSITFYCFEEKPVTAIPIQIEVNR